MKKSSRAARVLLLVAGAITAVEATAANVGDGQVAMDLLKQQAEVGLEPAEVVADRQYAAGELREQARSHGEGTTLVTKASALHPSRSGR